MNRMQKFAILNLILSSVGLTIGLVYLLVANTRGLGITISALAFVLCCFLMASYIFRYKLQKQGSHYYDERDKLIHKKAAFAGAITMILTLSFLTLLTSFIFLPDNSISISLLMGIVSFGFMSFFFAESIATLIQYRLGGKGEES